jgi:hypothetical protein
MSNVILQHLPVPLKEMVYSGLGKEYSKSLQLNTARLDKKGMGAWKCESLLVPREFIKLIQMKTEEKYSDQKSEGESRSHFRSAKWKSLGKKLFLDHHAVFFMENQFYELYKSYLNQKEYIPYLYADERIDSRYIMESIKIWYKQEFQEELSLHFNLDWETLFISSVVENDTNIIYRLLPAYLHHDFCKREHVIAGLNNNQQLKFYHCIKEDGTTSCVSELVWKDTKATSKKEQILAGKILFGEELDKQSKSISLPFSYEIQCKVVTKPFQPDNKFINISSNLKRYVYWDISKDKSMSWEGGLTCLIAGNALFEHHSKNACVEVKLVNEKGILQVKSQTELALFNELYKENFSLSDFVNQPYPYLKQKSKGNWIAPVYNVQYFSGENMLVEQGIGLQERNEIFLHVCQLFGFKPEGLLKRENASVTRSQLPYHPTQNQWSIEIEVWDTKEKTVFYKVGESFGRWLEVDSEIFVFNQFDHEELEILNRQPLEKKPSNPKKERKNPSYYKYKVFEIRNPKIVDDVINAIRAYFNKEQETKTKERRTELFIISQLNLKDSMDQPYHRFYILTPNQEITLIFSWKDIGDLTNELYHKAPENGKKKKIAESYAEDLRIQEAEVALKKHKRAEPIGAIINIPDYHKNHITKMVDPKKALRKGFISQKRITQFVNGEHRNKHPYLASIEDVLKDTAIYPEKLYSVWKPGDVWIGFDQIDLKLNNSKKPVLVACKIPYGEKPMYAFVYEGTWYPLQKMMNLMSNKSHLEKLFTDHKSANAEESNALKDKYSKLVRNLLDAEMTDENKNKQFYIVFSAALRNRLLKEMQNGSLSVEAKPFGLCGENVVVYRYNDSTEVPMADVLTIKEKKVEVTKGSGLYFTEDCKIFYSVGAKSDADPKDKLNLNKEDAPHKAISRQIPREIIVLGEPDPEKRKSYAKLVHRIRNCTITFNKEISEVLPIHYIHVLKKYI